VLPAAFSLIVYHLALLFVMIRHLVHIPKALSRRTVPAAVSRLYSTRLPSDASDPYPLPLSSQALAAAQEQAQQEAMPLRMERPNEDADTLRARLIYQTRNRGTLESDLLLSTFARERLWEMNEEEMREFDRLLDEPDWNIYYWAIGKREPPERWAGTELLEKLRVHAKNEGKVMRRMPDLS